MLAGGGGREGLVGGDWAARGGGWGWGWGVRFGRGFVGNQGVGGGWGFGGMRGRSGGNADIGRGHGEFGMGLGGGEEGGS